MPHHDGISGKQVGRRIIVRTEHKARDNDSTGIVTCHVNIKCEFSTAGTSVIIVKMIDRRFRTVTSINVGVARGRKLTIARSKTGIVEIINFPWERRLCINFCGFYKLNVDVHVGFEAICKCTGIVSNLLHCMTFTRHRGNAHITIAVMSGFHISGWACKTYISSNSFCVYQRCTKIRRTASTTCVMKRTATATGGITSTASPACTTITKIFAMWSIATIHRLSQIFRIISSVGFRLICAIMNFGTVI